MRRAEWRLPGSLRACCYLAGTDSLPSLALVVAVERVALLEALLDLDLDLAGGLDLVEALGLEVDEVSATDALDARVFLDCGRDFFRSAACANQTRACSTVTEAGWTSLGILA